MRRTTLVRLGTSTLLALGAVAVPGQAVSTATATDDPAPQQAVAAPAQLAAMQRDLGLTPAQAVERLRHEAVATRQAPAAQRAAGPTFGGLWYDAATGDLVVALTDQSRAAAVRATGARTTAATVSAARLDDTLARIDAAAEDAVPDGVHSWAADPRTGSVVVRVGADADTAAVDAFVAPARTTGPVSVVRETAAAPRTFAAGTVGGDPYYTGNVRCSIGFSVHGGYVTAGHCARAGAFVRGWDGSDQGWFQGSSFPGNDYAWVSVGYGWWTVPVVLGWGTTSDRLVRGSWEAPVGTSVCRSGSTTHWHCGVIQGKNETVDYGNGALFYGATKTSVCAEGGDSGGSFITGDQAQGVTSGGWGNCSSGGQTWFQPVNEILQRYGLTLHTA